MAVISAEEKMRSLILVLTEAAQGAGLPEERAEAVYTELIERYVMMDEDFAGNLLEEVQRLLNM
jgi:hypothetical protein